MSEQRARELTSEEGRLLSRLISEDFPGRDAIARQVRRCLVRPLDRDGSLEFQVAPGEKADVKSRIPVEGSFEDADGVTIHVLLHVVDGQINELELYKDDGSPIVRAPDPATLRLFHPG